jgi:hypothetical protein
MKLAKLRIPSGGNCLGSGRIDELGRQGAEWTREEEAHLRACNWCRYLWTHGEDDCIKLARMLALSVGAQPTAQERGHLAECPACSWEYQELCRPEPAGMN